MEDIIYDADTEPIIEELITSEEEYKEIRESIEPNLIKLKRGFVLKRCNYCGYERQMFPYEKECRIHNCRSKDLEVLDVDKINKEMIQDAINMKKSLDRDYKEFYKDKIKKED